jgi:hypothetical protein
LDSRAYTQQVVRQYYLPAMQAYKPVVIFLQTAAYSKHIRDIDDLGSFTEFSDKLAAGMQVYQSTCLEVLPDCRIARLGEAVRTLYLQQQQQSTKDSLFSLLYQKDGRHFTMVGSWLEACILYCTMTRTDPPVYNAEWWKSSRILLYEPAPTPQQAETLRQLAIATCRMDYPPESAT